MTCNQQHAAFVAVVVLGVLFSMTSAVAQSVAPGLLGADPAGSGYGVDYVHPAAQYTLLGYLGHRLLSVVDKSLALLENLRADFCNGTTAFSITVHKNEP